MAGTLPDAVEVFPPDTVAELITSPRTPAAIEVSSWNPTLSPAAMARGKLQVTTCPALAHAQSTPDQFVRLSPRGRSSVTTAPPGASFGPSLATRIDQTAWVFEILLSRLVTVS